MNIQTIYQKTLIFASLKHIEQTIPSTEIPYVVHISNVAMEILIAASHTPSLNLDLAIQLALLHDTIEDTETTHEELENEFGLAVADGVLALSKDSTVPKEDRMLNSLKRIQKLGLEVRAVKLADRITNLQKPPIHWDNDKKIEYRKQAIVILNQLSGGNNYLENRLKEKIKEYESYID